MGVIVDIQVIIFLEGNVIQQVPVRNIFRPVRSGGAVRDKSEDRLIVSLRYDIFVLISSPLF